MFNSSVQYLSLTEGAHLFCADTGGVVPSKANHDTFLAAALAAEAVYDNPPGDTVGVEYGMHVIRPVTPWGALNKRSSSQLGMTGRDSYVNDLIREGRSSKHAPRTVVAPESFPEEYSPGATEEEIEAVELFLKKQDEPALEITIPTHWTSNPATAPRVVRLVSCGGEDVIMSLPFKRRQRLYKKIEVGEVAAYLVTHPRR